MEGQVTIDVEYGEPEALRRFVNDLVDEMRDRWTGTVTIKGLTISRTAPSDG